MDKTAKFIYFIVCFAFFIFADLYTTHIILENMDSGSLAIDNPVFAFNFVKNTGAAFGILQGNSELLVILSILAVLLLIAYLIKNLGTISLKMCFFIALLSGGITCNFHERMVYGYVRDYFQLNFINFPVFNISDVFINVGVIAIIVLILIQAKNGRKRKRKKSK